MSDYPTDDARLDKTEAQMRRALGLSDEPPARSTPHQSTIAGNGSHPQRRQFVRDGDVPVTIIHHQPGGESANQLDSARTAMRSLAAAKERAERFLEQAQAQVHDLQTKLGHERVAKDEAIGRVNTDRRSVEQALESVRADLAAEKIARERAERALRDARATITNLSEKLHIAQQTLQSTKAELAVQRGKAQEAVRKPIAAPAVDAPVNGEEAVQTVCRPRGRPRKPIVVQMVEKPDGDGFENALRRRGRPPKPTPAKPVKWWLGER